ncbi:MAG: hypothetical protein ACC682_11010 [Gemmatimonadota bacterium]
MELMTKKARRVGLFTLAVGCVLAANGCGDSGTITIPCIDSRTPFRLIPGMMELIVGEEGIFYRVARESGECGLHPDSEELIWSLSVEGVVEIVAFDNTGATVRADSAGVVSLIAELVALEGVGWSTRIFVDDPED